MSEFKKQYLPAAVAAAQKYGLDPVMFAAQIEQESGWNPAAKSKAGARGLGQFMPATAKALGVNPLDPLAALDASARYMAQLRDKFGSEDLARQAYNAGEGALAQAQAGKRKLSKETLDYNPSISQRAQKLAQELGMPLGSTTAQAAPATQGAGAPGATRPKVADAAAQALQEMNLGLPPGAMNPEPAQASAPAQGDWRQALAQMSTPMQTPAQASASAQPPDFDMLAALEDAATKNQDRVLAGMFGDMQGPGREDTSILPASIDRYLDKVLA